MSDPLPDGGHDADQGHELGHQSIMVGHHLEEMVGLGANLTGYIHFNLVNVMLELLLDKSASRLHMFGIL